MSAPQHYHHNHGRNPLFRDPIQLVTDLFFLFFTLVYVPLRNLLRSILQKPKSLKGKVCLVTGSGRGLGREICFALAQEGAVLACADINEENNKTTVQRLTDMKAKAKGYKLNVANKDEVDSVVKQIQEDLGPIYMLVNNAGIIIPSSNPSEEYIRATFNVNTLGAIWMTMAVLPTMKKRNDGHIVNISSISGLYGTPLLTAYAASKAALSNFSQSLRLELSFDPNNQIYVTCVHPDVINTSEDYVELVNTRITARSVKTVTADIMYAIKHNKTDISSPAFYYYLYALNVLFPSEVIHKFIKLLDVTMSVPSQSAWEKLPVAEIVRSCRPPDDNEETMKLLASDSAKLPVPQRPRKISFTTTNGTNSAGENGHHGEHVMKNGLPVPAVRPVQRSLSQEQAREHLQPIVQRQLSEAAGKEHSQHAKEQTKLLLQQETEASPKNETPVNVQQQPQDAEAPRKSTSTIDSKDGIDSSPTIENFTIRSLRESNAESLSNSIRSLRVSSIESLASNNSAIA